MVHRLNHWHVCMTLIAGVCGHDPFYGLAIRKRQEFLDHALIDRALERHDQPGEVLHRLPAPADELGLVPAAGACDIDLIVLAGEAHREPLLPLAAVASLPGAPGDRARNIVGEPLADLAELLDRADAGLFVELALGGLPKILAGVDAALRHLPDMGFVDMLDAAGASTDEDQPALVDQHHADAGPVGQIFVTRHSVKASTQVCPATSSNPGRTLAGFGFLHHACQWHEQHAPPFQALGPGG